MRRIFVLMSVVGLLAAPAWAQTTGTQSGGSRLRLRAFGHAEWQTVAAKESFEAVTGKTSVQGFGGGAEVQKIWKGVFARLAITRSVTTGERVFVFNNEVIPLGIPLEITMQPLELAAGWRFKPLTSRRIVPYIGVGAAFLKYKETSDADATGEGIDESYKGVALFGGIDVPVWRFVSVGGEVGWRQSNVPKPAGAMDAFGEKDLGGVTMRLMLSIWK
jgi:hypothetical protein